MVSRQDIDVSENFLFDVQQEFLAHEYVFEAVFVDAVKRGSIDVLEELESLGMHIDENSFYYTESMNSIALIGTLGDLVYLTL